MEHQTAIAYGSGYENYWDEFDYIILHESAHEWWGNSVTATDFSDIWLHEGFATYAEILFFEKNSSFVDWQSYNTYTFGDINNVKPVIQPFGVRFWDMEDADVYNKGAALLHTLRNQFTGYQDFKHLLRKYYQTYKYKNATTDDFRAMVEKENPQTKAFFEQYLYDTAVPVLKFQNVYNELNPDTSILIYWFENVKKDFNAQMYMKSYDGLEMLYPVTSEKQFLFFFDPLDIFTYYMNYFGSYYRLKQGKLTDSEIQKVLNN